MDAYDELGCCFIFESPEAGSRMVTQKVCMKYSARFKNDEPNGFEMASGLV